MITYDMVDQDDMQPNVYSAEASTLGLGVGVFPTSLKTNLGNELAFVEISKHVVDGELIYVRYDQQFGCISLIVFND